MARHTYLRVVVRYGVLVQRVEFEWGSLHFAQCDSAGLSCYKILSSSSRFLNVLIFRVLELCAYDVASEQSIQYETLEVLFAGLLRCIK